MIDLKVPLSILEKVLNKEGFKPDSTSISNNFSWRPDYIVKRAKEVRAFLFRQTDTVPSSLIERLSSTKTKKTKLFINIVFLTKPTSTIVKKLNLHGIGILHFNGIKFLEITKSKNFSSLKEAKKIVVHRKKMMKTEIFISSQQNIRERKTMKNVIKDIHNRDKFPIYPFQAEDDPRFGGSRNQTKKCIDEGLKNCEWFIGLIAEEWRYWVDYEIKQAIKNCFNDMDITIYVKSTKATEVAWTKLLSWIKKRNLKYLPYSDITDLKTKLALRILAKIESEHKKLGISMYN
jgi:hypothetical protein